MPLTAWTERDELLSDALHMRDVALGLADPAPYTTLRWQRHPLAVDQYLHAWHFEDEQEDQLYPDVLATARWMQLEDYLRELDDQRPGMTSQDKPAAYSIEAHDRRAVLASRWTDGAAAAVMIDLSERAELLVEGPERTWLTPRASVHTKPKVRGINNPHRTLHPDRTLGGQPWPPPPPPFTVTMWRPHSKKRSGSPPRSSSSLRQRADRRIRDGFWTYDFRVAEQYRLGWLVLRVADAFRYAQELPAGPAPQSRPSRRRLSEQQRLIAETRAALLAHGR